MPLFKFDGFQQRSTVALSVSQNGNADSAGLLAWGQANATIEISARTQANVVDPAPVWLEAVNPLGFAFDDPGIAGYVPAHHEITYIWCVRGNPLPAHSAPTNLMPGWNNANLAYGPKVAFSLPAGAHIIDLFCVKTEGANAGVTAVNSWTVDVERVEMAYPGTKTICYSNEPSESWSGEVPGCLRAKTASDIESAIQGTGPFRLLFKRGQMVTEADLPSQINLDHATPVRHWGAWGPGTDRARYGFFRQKMFNLHKAFDQPQFTISDFHFQSDWDPVSETGFDGRPFSIASPEVSVVAHVHNCHFSGECPASMRKGLGNSIVLSDTVITDWRNFGIIMGVEDQQLALVGCDLFCNPDAMHGGPKVGRMYNNHGPFRSSRSGGVYIGASSFLSRQNWSVGGADQPCLRLNTNGIGGSIWNIDRVSCEGGSQQMVNSSINANRSEVGTYLFDKVLLIGCAKSFGVMTNTDHGGATMRNIYGIQPDVRQYVANSQKYPLSVSEGSGAIPEDGPQRFYNLTFVNLRRDVDYLQGAGQGWRGDLTDGTTSYSDITFENNVILAPYQTEPAPILTDGPLDLATPVPGITPRYKGVRYNYRPLEAVELSQHTPIGQSFVIPYEGINEDLWDDPQGATPATDQAYWRLHEATDIRHHIYVNNNMYYAQAGEFMVGFDADGVTITNTSGRDWYGPEPEMSGNFAVGVPDSATISLAYQNGSVESDFTRGIKVKGRMYVEGEEQNVALSFQADHVVVTNKSNADWSAHDAYRLVFYREYSLRLDRSSRLPPMRSEFANPATIPLARPLNEPGGQGVSPAIGAADAGMTAYDDLLMTVRPNSRLDFDHHGDPVPEGGNDAGALLEAQDG